jgi:hypothetical protein
VKDEAIRAIRAAYTAETVTVYQAYAPQIACATVRAGTFVPPFSRDRMTWIKGLSGEAMHRYCDGWIRSITDITATVREVSQLVRARRIRDAALGLPARVYPVSQALAWRIGAEPGTSAPGDGWRARPDGQRTNPGP